MEDKYPWLQRYPEGIPHSINSDQYDSLVDVIRESAEKHNSQVAFENIG
ncbi:MAG: long-chain acyl-CoA synthetase, partial [Bacteroidia bacterium]